MNPRRYIFTPALRTELRLAYAMPKRKRAEAITALEHKTGWPRHIFRIEAQRLNVITSQRRPWTKGEDSTLAATLGKLSVHAVAKLLGRTHENVKARAERLEMSIRIQSGYCVADLSKILGAPRYRVDEWIEKGLLGIPTETSDGSVRIGDESVRAFIRENAALIDFRLADQTFIKGVLYSSRGHSR
jgi:hypothetical protein